MKFFGVSYKGRRGSNQDRYFCGLINGFTILAVADGMGGHKGGETASQLAIDTLVNVLDDQAVDNGHVNLKSILESVFLRADEAIANAARENESLIGMGTTLTCLLEYEDRFVCGSIGDSRCYKISGNQISCITTDHTYLQEYIQEFGRQVPEEIQKSGHVLTKALNGEGDKPDLFPGDEASFPLEKKDLFLLVSDGLVLDRMYDFSIVAMALAGRYRSLQTISEELICHAYYSGSKDNCTVVAGTQGKKKARGRPGNTYYNFPPDRHPPPERLPDLLQQKSKKPDKKKVAMAGTMLAVALLMLVLLFMRNVPEHSTVHVATDENVSPMVPPAPVPSEESAFKWERGFTSIPSEAPFFPGDQVTWSQPESGPVSYYVLRVYQEDNLILEESTKTTSFAFKDEHGYGSGSLEIELFAMSGEQAVRPRVRSRIVINYQQN